MSVTLFPKRRIYPDIVSAQEMYAQPDAPDEMIWAICPRLKVNNPEIDPRCKRCPKWEDSEHGKVQRMCYGLANETCRIIFAVQAKAQCSVAERSVDMALSIVIGLALPPS